jgi:hypothetical protein
MFVLCDAWPLNSDALFGQHCAVVAKWLVNWTPSEKMSRCSTDWKSVEPNRRSWSSDMIKMMLGFDVFVLSLAPTATAQATPHR